MTVAIMAIAELTVIDNVEFKDLPEDKKKVAVATASNYLVMMQRRAGLLPQLRPGNGTQTIIKP